MSNIHFYMAAYQVYCFFKLIFNLLLQLVIMINLGQGSCKGKKKQGKTKILIFSTIIINLTLDSAYCIIYANEVFENCGTTLNLIAGGATTTAVLSGMLTGSTILQPLRSIESFCKTETLPTAKDVRSANLKMWAILIYGVFSLLFFSVSQFYFNNSKTLEEESTHVHWARMVGEFSYVVGLLIISYFFLKIIKIGRYLRKLSKYDI